MTVHPHGAVIRQDIDIDPNRLQKLIANNTS